MSKKKILVVEDTPSTSQSIIKILSEYDCFPILYMEDLEKENLQHYDLILLDREINGGDAWDWLKGHNNREGQKFPFIILMSGKSDIEKFAEYKKLLQSIDNVPKDPPNDFYQRLENAVKKIFFPQSFENIRTKLSEEYDGVYKRSSQEVKEQDFSQQSKEKDSSQKLKIIGIDASMKQVMDKIEKFAGKNIPITITGETGTGKELVANALHNKSKRKENPFVIVNLSALSENIIESELFGHVKGAFTGAITDRKGKIKEADGGTLFLDEIADISPYFQVKLLRVLESKQYEKIGSNKSEKVDVRIVTATNKDLQEEVRNGKFREDLYFRLACVKIKLPSLRKRSKKDFDLLLEYFIREYEKENILEEGTYHIDQKVYDKLYKYPWPGNIRELKWTIYQILAEASDKNDHPIVKEEHLPEHILNPVCQGKIQDEINQLLHKIVEKLPVEIFYDQIKEIQEDIAVFLLRRLYESSNYNWREVARKCGRPDECFCRPDKMKDEIKRIYNRVTQKNEDESNNLS